MVLPLGLWCSYCQMAAGDVVILKPSSFTCLVSGLRELKQLVAGTARAPRASLSLWTLHMVALEELDFLRGGWRLLEGWLKATRGTGPRETSRSFVAFSNPASEVTQCHFYNILFIKTVTEALPGAKKGDTDFTFWWDECQWIFRHVSASLLHIWETWKEMNTSSQAFKELEFELGAMVFR